MKFKFLIYALVAASMIIVGCEDDDDDNDVVVPAETLITASRVVVNIEYNGPGIANVVTIENDLILDLSNTSITRQRVSCSGFNVATSAEIAEGDLVEYTYYASGQGTDLSIRTIAPITAKFYRDECLNPEPTDQSIPESPLHWIPAKQSFLKTARATQSRCPGIQGRCQSCRTFLPGAS